MQIAFPLEQDDDGYPPFAEEVLWARKVSDTVGELVNAPFFVYGVSSGDIVSFLVSGDGAEIVFDELLSVRGHSTLRVVLLDDSKEAALVLRLRELGCAVETGRVASLLAVDVPPGVAYPTIREILETGEAQELWEYEEASLSQEHGE
ncbi:DUF4265 domain-containing protein [Streptomyces sp. NPDC055105]|uniref:DUF4265 domain-containing protein n=1 Tax=Streptomyces sp. NPDC055105 TaxID=3365719 RepID=UPI0037D26C5B